jgi:hypothetical protein
MSRRPIAASVCAGFALAASVLLRVGPGVHAQTLSDWYEPGQAGLFPVDASYANDTGRVGVLNAGGPTDLRGHPFFDPLGTNGRACVTCHQPASGMSVSAASIRSRWKNYGPSDPLFAAIDGSNCPNLPQDQAASHSLLLNRGLFRITLPWPPRSAAGATATPEFRIEVVRDPTGCNTDTTFGLKSPKPMVSVFRRPRPVANLKYVVRPGQVFNIKTGTVSDVDPDTGLPVAMNLMSDARAATLKLQAMDAAAVHEQATRALSADEVARIVEFERQIYMAQVSDAVGGDLTGSGVPPGLGPQAMLTGTPGRLGDYVDTPVFQLFDLWKTPRQVSGTEPARAFKASVARGADLYMFRQFWIRDAAHINSLGLGNPIKRTCATCHNAQMTGQDLAPGWVDLGTTNYPKWTEQPLWDPSAALPVFKITCDAKAAPHPYLGRVIYTTDPGRALITGRCVDVGSIVMQQLRGLAARAPYFANGSAATLRELVDYYDRRFDMRLSESEKVDLINFLRVL